MPVSQLEKLTAGRRHKRVGVFTEAHAGTGFLLTAICWVFEAFLFRGGFVLLLLFLPDTFDARDLFGDSSPGVAVAFPELVGLDGTGAHWLPLVRNGFHLIAMALVEPFYVAAGFALYINRRVEIEGWDIEIGFRRMAARLSRIARASAAVLFLVLLAGTAAAKSASDTPDFRATIDRVLAAPEFETTKQIEAWAPVHADEPEQSESSDLDLGFAAEIGRFLATLLVWALGGMAVAVLLYLLATYLRRHDTSGNGPPSPRTHKPDSLFGLDLRPDSLPPDLLGAAQRLWSSGDAAGAMSLLYRGALAFVIDRLRVDIPASATEGECMAAVRGELGPPISQDFEVLTRAWLLVAYADRPPTPVSFDDLCRRWHRHLRPTA